MSDVVRSSLATAEWRAFRQEGTSFAVLRPLERGGAVLFSRFARGVHGGRHFHPGGEDLYVIAGKCRVDEIELSAGDYLHTPPGASHELVAEEDTVVLVVLPQAPAYD